MLVAPGSIRLRSYLALYMVVKEQVEFVQIEASRNMSIRKKSDAKRFLEGLRGGPLTFGRMIESIRAADEISQATLAKRMKISRAHLCDLEKGRRTVTVERAAQFAGVLGYSVHQFVATALQDQLRKAGVSGRVHLESAA